MDATAAKADVQMYVYIAVTLTKVTLITDGMMLLTRID